MIEVKKDVSSVKFDARYLRWFTNDILCLFFQWFGLHHSLRSGHMLKICITTGNGLISFKMQRLDLSGPFRGVRALAHSLSLHWLPVGERSPSSSPLSYIDVCMDLHPLPGASPGVARPNSNWIVTTSWSCP